MDRTPKQQRDYALDLSTPIRFVTAAIADASPSAIAIAEMARSYKGFGTGDIHRVRVNEKLSTDAEAIEWLLEYAVERIMRRGKKGMGADQIVRENGGYRLADGVAFETLEYDGKPIGRDHDAHKMLRDPFNPLTGGEFSENIRASSAYGDKEFKELCESIEALGYIQDPGIVKDERGVVLSGHRRLAALEKAGIDPTPHVTIKRFGDGDAADMERLKFALALNTAQKPFTPKDRKRIAEYLYGTGEWSMARIGELLKVSSSVICGDLEGIKKEIKMDGRGRPHVPPGAYDGIKIQVMEDLKLGLPQKVIARKYGVSQATVARWNQPGLNVYSVSDRTGNTPSLSKIPEDQQQAFFRAVLDEDRPQAEAVSEIAGKPVKSIPTAWRNILAEERGRRQALAEIAPQQAVKHQCICPHCGHVFAPDGV